MNIIKTEGIIIRSQDYLESSKIVTCYTKDYGKVALIAKGARRPKSKFGGAIDLLHQVQLVYYLKENRELQTLSQADIFKSFHYFSSDISRFSLALAAAEIVIQLEMKEHPNPQLYSYFVETLTSIEKANNPELILYQFVWRWLETSGFRPKLRRCLKCGQFPANETVRFKFSLGGYYCSNCKFGTEGVIKISIECIHLILELRDSTPIQLVDKRIEDAILSEVKYIIWRFLQHHVEGIKELKALRFYKKISRTNENRVGTV